MAQATRHSFSHSSPDWSISFNVLLEGHSDARDAVLSVRQPPWGNYTIVHAAGRGARTFSATLYVPDEANWQLLLAHVNDTGTLNWGVESETAVLRSVRVNQYLPGGQRLVGSDWVLDAD